jgi:D-alanyl-D-alanine dipeptidase
VGLDETVALLFHPAGALWIEDGRAEPLAATPEPAEWRATRLVGAPWRGSVAPPGLDEDRYVVAEARAATAPGGRLVVLERGDALAAHGLVRLDELLAGGVVALRYKDPDNFTHQVLYPQHAACYLARPVADALLRAHDLLGREGLGLLVYDCYRPASVQARMWQVVPDPRYVAPPGTGTAPHTRGLATDVGLVDARGRPLEMPTAHDDFSARAAADATVGISAAALGNRAHLREAMQAHGFTVNKTEWWHFNGAGSGPPIDLPFPPALSPALPPPDGGAATRSGSSAPRSR